MSAISSACCFCCCCSFVARLRSKITNIYTTKYIVVPSNTSNFMDMCVGVCRRLLYLHYYSNNFERRRDCFVSHAYTYMYSYGNGVFKCNFVVVVVGGGGGGVRVCLLEANKLFSFCSLKDPIVRTTSSRPQNIHNLPTYICIQR